MSKHTLLIVDDEPNVLKSLKRLFIGTDYRILTAESAEEGLKEFEKQQIHLVISDYRMPQMNGVQFLRKVKELYPETIRIILSGYADVAAIVEAINDGQVYKFLAKPWNDQELLTTVRRSLEHFKLERENYQLLHQLQTANKELKKMARGLETKVDERTHDLALKNRALITAQKILNLLPVGVLGVDSQEMIVYANQALRDYINTDNLVLGLAAEGAIPQQVLSLIHEAIRTQKTTCAVGNETVSIGIVCTPLPDQRGAIAVFSYTDMEKYGQQCCREAEEAKVEDAG